MTSQEYVWAQQSEIKGDRYIRFLKIDEKKWKWLGPVNEMNDDNQFIYWEVELLRNRWTFLGELT